MNIRKPNHALSMALICCIAILQSPLHAQSTEKSMSATPTPSHNYSQRNTAIAKGTFEVDVKPVGTPETAYENTLGRMSLNKRFSGDLTGTGKGEMLTAMTAVKGSAGYVAIERVNGTLAGKSGSFVLQHTGTMDHGTQNLSISVVPDSGTGQLQGIRGDLRIRIVEGKHFYEFEYSMPK